MLTNRKKCFTVMLNGGGGGASELARVFAANKLRVVLMIVNNLFIL